MALVGAMASYVIEWRGLAGRTGAGPRSPWETSACRQASGGAVVLALPAVFDPWGPSRRPGPPRSSLSADHPPAGRTERGAARHPGGIEETLMLYQGERGRPRARRMLTEIDPTKRRVYDLFGVDACAPKR